MPIIIETLFFAVAETMYPIKRRMLPPTMNQRRPKRSELAPQILFSTVSPSAPELHRQRMGRRADLHEGHGDCHGVHGDVPRLLGHITQLRGHEALDTAKGRDNPEGDAIGPGQNLGVVSKKDSQVPTMVPMGLYWLDLPRQRSRS
jgi:hypothetical protein